MGHDDTRGKGASDSAKPDDQGTNPVSELSDLHSAFDFIDDSMKEVARRDVTVSPEALEQIVNDAVAKAITAYEQARGATPDSSAPPATAVPNLANDIAPRQPVDPAAVPQTPWRANLERLQDDMGLDEIEFESPAAEAAEPSETVVHHTLSKQMGVHDFEFDDIPGAVAEPAAPAPLDIDGVTEWMNTSAASPDVGQLRAIAGGKAKTREGEQEFNWVAAELAALDAAQTGIPSDPPAAPIPDPAPPPYEAPGPVAPAIGQPRADFDKPEGLSPRVHKPKVRALTPEVRETRGGLAGWFRSTLGDRLPQREPARVPAPGPATPPMTADSVPRQPEPEIEAPAPVAAQADGNPSPTREPAAAVTSTPEEEAADTVRFTFDPIPPVPPRLPRDPKEPPRKINKSGTFL